MSTEMTSSQHDHDGLEEAVGLFEPDSSVLAAEMRYSDFEALVEGSGTLDQFAASVARAAYAIVGTGLSVQGIVFFQFKVDEEGKVDSAFNVPLRYLIENAGMGPDLGAGRIRLACRSQCPVPWHAKDLWEPAGEGDENPAHQLQKAIWRNRLGLKPRSFAPIKAAEDFVLEDVHSEQRELEAKLTTAFGAEGKVNLESLIRQNSDHLTKVSTKYRSDLEAQQQTYLDQIRSCRDEIQKLKVDLRNEQQRSRRLQELLRGEP